MFAFRPIRDEFAHCIYVPPEFPYCSVCKAKREGHKISYLLPPPMVTQLVDALVKYALKH